jgi:hypothetical protein
MFRKPVCALTCWTQLNDRCTGVYVRPAGQLAMKTGMGGRCQSIVSLRAQPVHFRHVYIITSKTVTNMFTMYLESIHGTGALSGNEESASTTLTFMIIALAFLSIEA